MTKFHQMQRKAPDLPRRESPPAACHELTRDNVALVQAQLTALQDLVRLAVGLVQVGGRDHLQVVVVRLVLPMRDVHVPVEGPRRALEARGRVRGVREPEVPLPEAQVVHLVGDVGHVRGEVVVATLGLDVEVARGAVDEDCGARC